MMHTDSNGDDDALICITVPKPLIHVDNANTENKTIKDGGVASQQS